MSVSLSSRRVLVTGANGFIGRNFCIRLREAFDAEVLPFARGDDVNLLPSLVSQADVVMHFAGENRPEDVHSFNLVNVGLTEALVRAVAGERAISGRKVPIVFTSSVQAEQDNPYGRSKLAAEEILRSMVEETAVPSIVFRLPGVFGKWSRPNYNSVVATFCYNVARGLPIEISDPGRVVRLAYIDDVVTTLLETALQLLSDEASGFSFAKVHPQYEICLADLGKQIKQFDFCRNESLQTARVGEGLTRALYSTYVSFLPTERFKYGVPSYEDSRGVFVEMLKTPDCGQFSYFTAHPGVTRGGHYHHTKTEKFLVIKGRAHFRFRNLLTKELIELQTDGCHPQVVDTVPGWIHDITNVGDEEMVVMLWANENFDRDKPDTIAGEI